MDFLTSQVRELGIAYALAAGSMLLALWLARADRRAYFRWPVYSAMAMALGVILWNLLRKHLVPGEWSVTHPAILYWGALAIYVVLGLSLGLMLGRLTRRPNELERGEGDRDESR